MSPEQYEFPTKLSALLGIAISKQVPFPKEGFDLSTYDFSVEGESLDQAEAKMVYKILFNVVNIMAGLRDCERYGKDPELMESYKKRFIYPLFPPIQSMPISLFDANKLGAEFIRSNSR